MGPAYKRLRRSRPTLPFAGMSLVIGLAGGVDTFASQAFGAGNLTLLGVVLQRALLINALACVPPASLWWAAGGRLLWWATDPAMGAEAMWVARRWVPVVLLHGSSQCVYRYLVAQGVSKPILAAGALCCAAAFLLNWLFILGPLRWGLPGAIAASICTEALYLAVLLGAALLLSRAAPQGQR